MFSLLLFLVLPSGNATFAWTVSALVLLASFGEKFRKLEISRHGIVYRRQFGPPRKAAFADIASIEKVKLGRWNRGRYFVPGMQLNLPNYDFLMIPLDLPNSDEVYDRIVKAWEAKR